MTIHVTQAHIDAGVKGQCTQCPIALALRQATGLYCKVSSRKIYLRYDDEPILLPIEAGQFTVYFDNGQPVQPFSFEVDIPVEANV